jgi:predicted nucleic acid-binding protein
VILLDTNVLVAAVVPQHDHHEPSAAILLRTREMAVAAHSLAEFVNTMTRNRHYAWSGDAVDFQIAQFEKRIEVLALRSGQYASALREFALAGHRGPIVYDYLIGSHAMLNGIDRIISWNIRHMQPLFPTLTVLTPEQHLENF